MAVRAKATVKDPYGDDKGFSTTSARRRAPPTGEGRLTQKLPRAKHFVRMSMDDSGRFVIDSSVSMDAYVAEVISKDVFAKFKDACNRHEKRLGPETGLTKSISESGSGGSKRTSKKRRKSEQAASESCEEVTSSSSLSSRRKTASMLSIRVSDTQASHDYYKTCLRAFQQINCRLVCKLWIKLIHPKKQVTNPYNGTQKDILPEKGTATRPDMEVQRPKDPEKTKPNWWAPNVRHKEPDHLKKNERIELMVYLIERCGRDDNHFNEPVEIMQLFEEVVKKKQDLHSGPSTDKDARLLLIRDMCELRETQKRWEDGEIDDDTEVQVESHEEHARKAEKEEATREARYVEAQKAKEAKVPIDLHALDLAEEPPMLTPTSSTASSTVYPQSHAPKENDIKHNSLQNQGPLATFSPQSMASYHSIPTSAPYNDLQLHQQTMVFGQHPSFHTTTMDSHDPMTGLTGPFVSLDRHDAIAPWTQHVPVSTHSYTHEVNAYSESGNPHPLQGIPVDEIAFSTQNFHPHMSVHEPADNCFQPVNQIDPRQLSYGPWKYRGLT